MLTQLTKIQNPTTYLSYLLMKNQNGNHLRCPQLNTTTRTWIQATPTANGNAFAL